jgi:RimJ/RimL family protein N-acetyltransferase
LVRPSPPLTDGHVVLRPFTADDISAVTTACQDPEIIRWTARIPWPYEETHARSWIATHERLWNEGAAAEFAVTSAVDDHLLGALGIGPVDWDRRKGTAGYWMAAGERCRGVATRALCLGTGWAFDTVGLTAMELVTMTGNVASERVAQKAGFHMGEEITGYEHPTAPGRRHHVTRWRRCARAE